MVIFVSNKIRTSPRLIIELSFDRTHPLSNLRVLQLSGNRIREFLGRQRGERVRTGYRSRSDFTGGLRTSRQFLESFLIDLDMEGELCKVKETG